MVPNKQDCDTLARTLYGEVRGEIAAIDGGVAALMAVGAVVRNRAQQQTWFGKTISEVCCKPQQFSCWNADDPNYPQLLRAEEDPTVWAECWRVAEGMLWHNWPDITRGADHYYALTHQLPAWAAGQHPVFRLRSHLFFRLSLKSEEALWQKH